jgi:hypothetical protein
MRNLLVLGLAAVVLTGFALPATAQEAESDESPQWNFEAYLDEAHSWGDLAVKVGPDSVDLSWTGLTLGDQASSDLRQLADGALSGEKDGQVDETELDDFTFGLTALFESQFGKYANNHAFSGFVLIDQAEAQKVEVTHVAAENLAGDVEQAGSVIVGVAINIAFPNVDDHKDVHTVRFDLGPYFIQQSHDEEAESLAGDLTLAVQGADGWSIDAESIQPACAAESFSEGRMVFAGDDVDCFTGHDGVLLSFAINGQGTRDSNFLPGFELVALVAALGAALFVRRPN